MSEMARNAAYQFVSTDTDTVAALLVEVYEKLTGAAVRPASPERVFIQWVADVVVQERVLNNYTGNQNIPSRAEGKNLDALAELTYIQKRPEAKPAACTMRFCVSEPQARAILIPAGTRVTDADSALVWQTEEDHYIQAGEKYVEAKARCQTAGTAGNGYAAGQISRLVDVYDYYSECSNINRTDGGSDRPGDDEYYELMRASMDAYSCAGARGSYVYWAKQVSMEIADVVANSPVPGIVKLYVLMKDGQLAGDEMKRAVLSACSADTVRPLTDWVFVEDAETVPYDIDLTYYVPSNSMKSGAALAAQVQETVDGYIAWQGGKLGRDINPSYLISLLMRTGIKRVEVRAPAFVPLKDGLGLEPPQLARLGKVSVTNGGFEDE